MAKIELGSLGYVEVDKRLKTVIALDSDAFFEKFASLADDLSIGSRGIIKEAMDRGDEVKCKKAKQEIENFFSQVHDLIGKYGVGEDEIDEIKNIDEMKGQDYEESQVAYDDGTVTIDRDTGEREGKILLGSGGKEGKIVPIIVNENLKMYLEHDGSLSETESETNGEIVIENISTKDRIWDIDLKLEGTDNTDMEEGLITLPELDAESSESIEYAITAEAEPALQVTEFISTLNDPDTAFYSLANNNRNEIYYAITVKNITENLIQDISLKKEVPELFAEYEILSSTIGDAAKDSEDGMDAILWSISMLEPDQEAKIEFQLVVDIDDKDTKPNSGKIWVDYSVDGSESGVKIEKFDAYTNNSFYIITSEMDDKPDTFECQFVFENRSEYMVRLVNADVYDLKDPDKKFVDIDPGEIPPLPAGAKWQSNVWEYESEESVLPQFRKKVEFFTLADHQIKTSSTLEVNDIELAVAALEGALSYNVTKLPSYKVTPFALTATVENTGASDLNDVVLTERIQEKFIPPKPEEVKVFINDEEIEVDPDWITVEPEDQDSTGPHTVSVKMENLKDTEIGPLKPGETVKITYPITADQPDQSSVYNADAVLIANTYPAGKPLEVEIDPIEIEVVHIRKKFVTGKNIVALADENEYEIVVYVDNKGEFPLENYVLTDRVPAGASFDDVSMDCEVEEVDDGVQVLTWTIDSIEPDGRAEVKYRLTAEGNASEAQDA